VTPSDYERFAVILGFTLTRFALDLLIFWAVSFVVFRRSSLKYWRSVLWRTVRPRYRRLRARMLGAAAPGERQTQAAAKDEDTGLRRVS